MTSPASGDDRTALEAELGLHREELLAQNEELRRTNAELSAARARLSVMFDAAPTGYAALDDHGRIVQANRTLASILGIDQAGLPGRAFDRALSAADRARLRRYLEAMAADGTPSTCDVALGPDRAGAVIRIVGAALPPSADDRVRVILAVTDESERRQLQAQRDAAEARLAELGRLESLALMAGGVAHDFNNLLAIMITQLTFVRLEVAAGSLAASALAQATGAAERAAVLSKQLLAYTGEGHVALRPFDLGEAIRSIEGLLRSSVAGRATIHLELTPEPLVAMGDDTQLHQVVMNLVLNAAESIAEPGVIAVRTRAEPGRLVLEVADDGRGMDAAALRRAFDPFFSTKSFGRGLGLSVVRGHVKAHGGTVEIDSVPGRGTTIRVLLPPASEPGAIPSGPFRGRGAVLIVDDEAPLRAALGLMVRSLGFTVYEASDGMEALDVLRTIEEPLAAILLDVMMPRMNGGATLAELRARGDASPVVLMSGYPRADAVRAGGAAIATADAFLEKPFSMPALVAALRVVMPEPPAASC